MSIFMSSAPMTDATEHRLHDALHMFIRLASEPAGVDIMIASEEYQKFEVWLLENYS